LTLKARYDQNCIESAVKRYPTNPNQPTNLVTHVTDMWLRPLRQSILITDSNNSKSLTTTTMMMIRMIAIKCTTKKFGKSVNHHLVTPRLPNCFIPSIIHDFLDIRVSPQTAYRSVHPHFRSSTECPTQRHTHTQTTLCATSVVISCISMHLQAMPHNNNDTGDNNNNNNNGT